MGYPPLSKEHSKMAMLDKLAPIAAKAYRRKKMSETKIKQLPCDQQTQEDMDIDDGNFLFFFSQNKIQTLNKKHL